MLGRKRKVGLDTSTIPNRPIIVQKSWAIVYRSLRKTLASIPVHKGMVKIKALASPRGRFWNDQVLAVNVTIDKMLLAINKGSSPTGNVSAGPWKAIMAYKKQTANALKIMRTMPVGMSLRYWRITP